MKTYTCSICSNAKSRRGSICRKCYREKDKSGDKSHTWKGGLPKCKTCSTQCASYESEYCRPCHDKISGKDHWRFKHGLRRNLNSKEYRFWRSEVFKRDEFTCVMCNVKGGYLHAHHIFHWSDFANLRFDIDNGLTMCIKCHYRIHHGGE